MTQPVTKGPVQTPAPPLERTFWNGLSLLGANVVTSGAQYVIVVIIARALGPGTFGTYVFAFTFASFFATICNFGLDRILIREIVRTPPRATVLLLAAAVLRLVLGALSAGLALTVSWWLGYAPELRIVIALLILSQGLNLFSELFRSVLFAAGAMPREARLRAIGRTVVVAAVGIGLLRGWSLIGLAGALAIGGALELLLYAGSIARHLPLRGAAVEWGVAKGLAQRAWPIALNTALVVLYLRINIVVLASWRGEEEVGLFGAAFTFVQVLQVVSGSLAGVLLPVLTARKLEGSDRVLGVVRTATSYTLLFVLPTAIGMSLLAGELTSLMYGSEYAGAVPALSVLAWANPFMFLGSLYGTLLIVLDAERVLIPLSAAALAVSAIGNYVLVPGFGSVGAAWATVVTEFSVAAIAFWAARNRLGPVNLTRIVMRPALVAGGVALALWTVPGPVGVRVLAGIAVFMAGAAAAEVGFARPPRAGLVARLRGSILDNMGWHR